MTKNFEEWRTSNFPGIDPEKFQEWFIEELFLDYDPVNWNDPWEVKLNTGVSSLLNMIMSIPRIRRCRILKKRAGITQDMHQRALKDKE